MATSWRSLKRVFFERKDTGLCTGLIRLEYFCGCKYIYIASQRSNVAMDLCRSFGGAHPVRDFPKCFGRRKKIMPLLPSRSCKKIGCSGIAGTHGYCVDCEQKGFGKDSRPSSTERGYDNRWRRYSALYLTQHQACRDPFKRHPTQVRRAVHLDHIIPHGGDQQLFWDERNHQGLCHSCHAYKTAAFDGGFGHQRKEFTNGK